MFSNIKRRVGVVSAVALMAALVPVLASSSATAAVALIPVAPASTSQVGACPTGSAPAAGFTDTTSTDVDCIKMHGITSGVTATTYEPDSSVPRWQMALFLTRFATSAGTALGSGADQGFTDIGDLSAEIQTAINQIKQLGVTTGTTATTYSPDSNVTREQMAMFVERMLGKTAAGPGGANANAAYSNLITTATLTYNYTDIDSGAVTYEGHNAIAEIYHLGVPGDAKTDTTFRPAADLTRGEMATWMTNALGHTNARPAGVWTQVYNANVFSTSPVLYISHRDASRQPVAGTPIDIFSDTNVPNTSAFAATGACNTTNTVELGNTVTECKIDVGDTTTDAKGNIGGHDGQAGGTTVAGYSTTFYAWTGALAASYNNLTAPATNAPSAAPATAATVLKMSNTLSLKNIMDATDATFEMVRYGGTVDITVQYKTSATGSNVAAPVGIKIVETTTVEGDDGAGADNAGGNVTASVVTTLAATDATGAYTHSVSVADPNPVGSATATVNDRHQTTTCIDGDLNGDGTYNDFSAGCLYLSWDDNPSVWSTTGVVDAKAYDSGLGAALGGKSRSVAATAYDQFGAGMAGQSVKFVSATSSGTTDVGDTGQFTDAVTRTTDSSGVATLAWTDTQAETGKQVVTASAADNSVSGTDTFYRILTTEPNFQETEASSTDGTTVANNFNIASGNTGLVTFGGTHSLTAGTQIYVDLGLLTGAVGANWTMAAHATDIFTTSTAHALEVGDVVKMTTVPASVNGISNNDFACVRSVVDARNVTLTAVLSTPQKACAATDAIVNSSANSSGNGVVVRVPVPLGNYYVATVPSTTTATLSATRTVSALGAVTYSTFTSDLVGAASTGTAKLTSANEFDTGDLYMEMVINDAASDTFVVENQLAAGNYDYHAYTYDSGDQFSVYADPVGGAQNTTAVSMATFETHMAAKFNAFNTAPNASQAGDFYMIYYVNENEGGGVSVFHLGS